MRKAWLRAVAPLVVLGLMYLFLLSLIMALRADARATEEASRANLYKPGPLPTSPPTRVEKELHVVKLGYHRGTLPTTGRQYEIYTPADIGRDAACTIVLPNRYVSSRHARLYPELGEWYLEDLGSTNGTLYNGEPLSGPQKIHRGDSIIVGDTELIVK